MKKTSRIVRSLCPAGIWVNVRSDTPVTGFGYHAGRGCAPIGGKKVRKEESSFLKKRSKKLLLLNH
jgi:hypothetical protein